MEEEIIDIGIAKIKINQVEETRIILISNCLFCDRKVRGSTYSQIEWNLVLHMKQKHKDNSEAEILVRQLEDQQK